MLYDKKTETMEVLCERYIEGADWYVNAVFIIHCVTLQQGVALRHALYCVTRVHPHIRICVT